MSRMQERLAELSNGNAMSTADMAAATARAAGEGDGGSPQRPEAMEHRLVSLG